MYPSETIPAFDSFLAERGLRLDGVLIGGAALSLLGVIERPTLDCDVLHPSIPEEVLSAARLFADSYDRGGSSLSVDWLNNGPASIAKALAHGWRSRLVLLFSGKAITFHTLGRTDLLGTKLLGLCDRGGQDLDDCIAFAPTTDELKDAAAWVSAHDGNPDWPEHVAITVSELAQRLGLSDWPDGTKGG